MLCDIWHDAEIAADPAKVYRAISTREGQAAFWAANNTTQPKVGSVAEFRFKVAPVPVRMRIDALEEGKRVAWTCLGEFQGWKDTTVTWELEALPEGRGTKVTFRHGNLDKAGYPEAAWGGVNYTWGQVLGRLKGYCEGGTPQPLYD